MNVVPFGRKRKHPGMAAINQDSLINSYGQEWLSLPPDVFQQVLNHGFPGDVYGGQYGVQNVIWDIGPIPQPALQYFGQQPGYGQPTNNPAYKTDPSVFVYRWDDTDQVWQILYYQPAYYDRFRYLLDNGLVQVRRNPYNGSWLSIGAQGGFRDPRLISWDDRFGLITPHSNYLEEKDSFWEAYGPMILFAGTMAGAILAQQAAIAASTAAEASTAATIAETGAALTEAQVAGEEALREIGLAQSLGATVTQSEAAGWVSALQSAGLSVPSDIASIANGIMPSGYQAPPSPPSGGAASATQTATAPTTSSLPSTSTLLKTATPYVTKMLMPNAVASKPQTSVTTYGAQPSGGDTSGFLGLDFSGNSTQGNIPGTNLHWMWLLVAGAGIYVISRRKKRA